MKVQYLIVAIVLFGCSCEEKIVTGYVVLNKNETVSVYNPSAIEPVAGKPQLLIQPRILVATNETNSSVSINDKLSQQPQVLPVVTSIKTADNLCAHMMCPMIYCKNNLPPIPSQGICCQRCVTNPKCNTTACPKYKCGTYLMPANLTAGECCDRCAPASTTTTTTTKTTSEAKKSRSSSSEEEANEENKRNGSEQHDEIPCGCDSDASNPKSKKSYPRLIRLLTESLAHFQDSDSSGRLDDSSESEDK